MKSLVFYAWEELLGNIFLHKSLVKSLIIVCKLYYGLNEPVILFQYLSCFPIFLLVGSFLTILYRSDLVPFCNIVHLLMALYLHRICFDLWESYIGINSLFPLYKCSLEIS